jgi:hypothetical protein
MVISYKSLGTGSDFKCQNEEEDVHDYIIKYLQIIQQIKWIFLCTRKVGRSTV